MAVGETLLHPSKHGLNRLNKTKMIKGMRGSCLIEYVLKLPRDPVTQSPSSSFLFISLDSSKMAELKASTVSYEDTKDRAKVELHDLSEGSPIKGKYMGTDSDRHDMIVLGRKQVLRVRKNTIVRSAAFRTETGYVDIVDLELIIPPSAQLPIPVYRGLCRRSHFYLGDPLCVCV